MSKDLHIFIASIGKASMPMWLIAALIAPTRHAQAQSSPAPKYENGFTLYGGYRFGGSVTDTANDTAIDLGNGSSFAVAGDIGLDPHRQIELFYSQQRTTLTSGAFSPSAGNRGLTLHNFQIGGTNFIEETGRGLYVMGGLGGTTATPNQAGSNSETFFSGNLGIGWMVPLGAHVGIKLEARGYGIVLNHNGALFCGGNNGCTVAIRGTALFEGEVLAGLAARF
jgi:Outer membrane protein beta-barrel domain